MELLVEAQRLRRVGSGMKDGEAGEEPGIRSSDVTLRSEVRWVIRVEVSL